MQVGLAGSSAIITSGMRALMEFYEVDIATVNPDLAAADWTRPALAEDTETERAQ
jgi:hypothetical protein